MKAVIAIFILFTIALAGRADTLITSRYKIIIDDCRPEGDVTSENVNFVVLNKKTQQTISGKGRTVHRTGADGVTPSGFVGYEFTKDKTRYFIYVDGELRVFSEGRLISDETGGWNDKNSNHTK